MSPYGSIVGDVDLAVVLEAERARGPPAVVEVRQDQAHLVDFVVAGEGGVGHDPDRGLDARAVVVGPRSRGASRGSPRTTHRRRRPASRSVQIAVSFVAAIRSSVSASVVYSSRGKPSKDDRVVFMHDQVLDARPRPRRRRRSPRPSRRGSPPRPGRTRPGAGGPATATDRQACSRTLTVARSTCGNARKCSARASAYASIEPSRCSLGERVGRVLHRVRGHDARCCRRPCARPRSRPRARSRRSGRGRGAASSTGPTRISRTPALP